MQKYDVRNKGKPDSEIWSANRLFEKYFSSIFSHAQNVVEKLVPKPFIKITKLTISLDRQSEMLYSLFLVYSRSTKTYQN